MKYSKTLDLRSKTKSKSGRKSSKNKLIANQFIDFMLSNDFQSIIPTTNIMYPVIKINNLPEAYQLLEIPEPIQIKPSIISANKESWIEEWLNAT